MDALKKIQILPVECSKHCRSSGSHFLTHSLLILTWSFSISPTVDVMKIAITTTKILSTFILKKTEKQKKMI